MISSLASRILLLAVAGSVCLAAPAQARDKIEDRLEVVEEQVVRITASVEDLERQVAPGRGFITESDAVSRYEDYVYLHMIGEHVAAAEGFFTLVTLAALADAGLHHDAEWYLAESLYAMGNTSTAEARYLVIADDDQHPFRDDAVRRLLELYAETGQTEEFRTFYQTEILEGRVRPSDMITYSLAKSFYTQELYAEAIEHFEQLEPGSPYYGKARYFLGTIAVVQGDLEGAIGHFSETADLAVDTVDARKVQDLALLALARIHYEQGALGEAAEYYGRVGGDSPYLDDKLYEIIWTFIKQEQYRAALDGVEIFLLRFPDHEYTAQLRLLDAHLRLEQKAFDSALTAYEEVIAEYEPVRERFGSLAQAEAEPREYFQQILAAAEGEQSEADGLPGFAVAMMVDQEGLSRALGVYREIVRQQDEIDESQALIAELRGVLDTAGGIGGYQRLRYDVQLDRDAAEDAQITLLRLEEELIEDHGDAEAGRKVARLRGQRAALVDLVESVPADYGAKRAVEARETHLADIEALRGTIAQLECEASELRQALSDTPAGTGGEAGGLSPGERLDVEAELSAVEAELSDVRGELDTLQARGPSTGWAQELVSHESEVARGIAGLRAAYAELRPGAPGARSEFERIDRLHTTLESNRGRLAALRGKLTETEAAELGRIRARFEHEVTEVGQQQVELQETLTEAEDVSVELTRAGFGRLEDFFAESVLRADMGIVDVYWSQKMDVADQRQRLAQEKATLLSDLEQRFELIRQKLGP